MAFDYNQASRDAYDIIVDFGQQITLTRQSESGGYDPETGDFLPYQPDTTINGVGVMLNYLSHEIDNTNILKDDARVICALLAEPDINMTLQFNGKTWRVISVITLKPAGVTIMHTLQVRA